MYILFHLNFGAPASYKPPHETHCLIQCSSTNEPWKVRDMHYKLVFLYAPLTS